MADIAAQQMLTQSMLNCVHRDRPQAAPLQRPAITGSRGEVVGGSLVDAVFGNAPSRATSSAT